MEKEKQCSKDIYEYEEIDLRELAEVLMRRKRVIFAVVLVAVVAALAVSFALPKNYEIRTALEIGTIVGSEARQALEDSVQLQEKIDNDVYGHIARRELEIAEQDYPKIKVDNLKDTNTIFVSTESSKTDEAQKIFEKINALILSEHEQKLEIAKKESEARIEIEKKNRENENLRRLQTESKLVYLFGRLVY